MISNVSGHQHGNNPIKNKNCGSKNTKMKITLLLIELSSVRSSEKNVI